MEELKGLREKILERVRSDPEGAVVTHIGSDLDQVIALEALRREAGVDFLTADRTPAGTVVPGKINIDVGDPSCTEPVTVRDDGTIVIDHHYNGYKNTLEILRDKLGFRIPEQAVKLADSIDEKEVSPLEWDTGLALARYVAGQDVWRLAEHHKLTEHLSQEDLEYYGLSTAAKVQRRIVTEAVEAVSKGALNREVVFVEQFVTGGAAVAYALGYKIYSSVSQHPKGGITFAITAAPGTTLPADLIEWGRELREKYGTGVFVNPQQTMIVVGGPKNPDFALPLDANEVKEVVLKKAVLKQSVSEKQVLALRLSR